MIPIQGLTAVLYVLTGLVGTFLYLNSMYAITFILTMVVTQIWRAYSETLRADYRGKGKISAYQIMAMLTTVYALVVGIFFSEVPTTNA